MNHAARKKLCVFVPDSYRASWQFQTNALPPGKGIKSEAEYIAHIALIS
jgi:hypothetical protein